jgi:hypothetical protein
MLVYLELVSVDINIEDCSETEGRHPFEED